MKKEVELSVKKQYCIYAINALSGFFGVTKDELKRNVDLEKPGEPLQFESLKDKGFLHKVAVFHRDEKNVAIFFYIKRFKASIVYEEFTAAEFNLEATESLIMYLHINGEPFILRRPTTGTQDTYWGSGGILVQDATDAFIIEPVQNYLKDNYGPPAEEWTGVGV